MKSLAMHWIGIFLLVGATALAGWLWIDAILTPGIQILPSLVGGVVLGFIAAMALDGLGGQG